MFDSSTPGGRPARAAFFAVSAAGALLALSWSWPSRAEPIDPDAPLAEVAAYLQARPAFERHCFRCHTSEGDEHTRKSLDLLDMGRYPFAGRRAPTAGRSVRRTLGVEGTRPSMPKDMPGTVTGDDLAVVLHWADTFDGGRAPKDRDRDRDKDKEPGPDGGAGGRR